MAEMWLALLFLMVGVTDSMLDYLDVWGSEARAVFVHWAWLTFGMFARVLT